MSLIEALKRKLKKHLFSEKAKPSPVYGAKYLLHNIPDTIPAGSVIAAKVLIENRCSFPWQSFPPEGDSVDLAVRIDGELVATQKMLQPELHPTQTAVIHFPLKVPMEPGKHTLLLELVKQTVTLFADQGVEPLIIEFETVEDDENPNIPVYHNTVNHDPWHYQPTRGVSRLADGTSLPLFASGAKGCKLWDLDGREYIDYVMGWGSTLLGYADDRVQEAIRECLTFGPTLPYPHAIEMDVARMLSEDIPCAEMAIFGKNGSDACSVAARAARIHTGRKKILYSGYHGWQDFWAEHVGYERTGVPDRPECLIYPFKFNDTEDFLRLFDQHRDDLAAVMIEPSGPWGGDGVGPEPDVDKTFLETLADATRRAGALLVFDEIVTNYRYPQGSVQKAKGVIPDLTCLGKALASGMPLSALVGRADILRACLPRVFYGPTFKGEIYSFAAARAAIEIYRSEPVADFIWDYGTRLREKVDELVKQHDIDAEFKGPPFRMALIFNDSDPAKKHLKRTLYHQELLRAGISTYNSLMLPCYSHDDATMELTVKAMDYAIGRVREAERTQTWDELLEIPPLVDL